MQQLHLDHQIFKIWTLISCWYFKRAWKSPILVYNTQVSKSFEKRVLGFLLYLGMNLERLRFYLDGLRQVTLNQLRMNKISETLFLLSLNLGHVLNWIRLQTHLKVTETLNKLITFTVCQRCHMDSTIITRFQFKKKKKKVSFHLLYFMLFMNDSFIFIIENWWRSFPTSLFDIIIKSEI